MPVEYAKAKQATAASACEAWSKVSYIAYEEIYGKDTIKDKQWSLSTVADWVFYKSNVKWVTCRESL